MGASRGTRNLATHLCDMLFSLFHRLDVISHLLHARHSLLLGGLCGSTHAQRFRLAEAFKRRNTT